MDTSKKNQAIDIIVSHISKFPANEPMEYGTVGALLGKTMREGEAYSLAQYIVIRMGGKITGTLPENMDDEERESIKLLKEMAAAAIAITGK